MQNLMKELKETLQKDDRFFKEDSLFKNVVIEYALKLDKDLLKMLYSNKILKELFFINADDITIFDKDKFIRFVSNKEFLPDSFTSFKNKIGLMTDNTYFSENRDVILSWPYKDCVLEGGMTKEDQKRNEVFYNETLAPDDINRLFDPKVMTNFKEYDSTGEHKITKIDKINFENESLIINGNNLLALHSLKKRYTGKVKLIYIDPPFNTNRDSFTYNDSFTHSTWLTFIKNRILIAYNLLSNDGNIFVHVDNNESHYIKILLDEIFGRDNFVNEIIWHKGREGGSSRSHSKSSSMPTEYQNIFVYAKNKNIRFWNPPLGPYKKSTIKRIEKDSKGWFYTRGRMGRTPAEWELKAKAGLKSYVSDRIDLDKEQIIKLITSPDAKYVALGDVWGNDIIKNTKESKYNTAKPEGLLKLIIEAATNPSDLVLDFFLGGGTTAAVCLKLNRRFIGIEQLEEGIDNTIPRLLDIIQDGKNINKIEPPSNNSNASFIFCELTQWNEIFIEKIKKAKSKKELDLIWEEIKQKAFLSYKINIKTIEENISIFENLSFENQQKFLIEILDKNSLYVNYSEIDDKEYNVSEDDKALNNLFYNS